MKRLAIIATSILSLCLMTSCGRTVDQKAIEEFLNADVQLSAVNENDENNDDNVQVCIFPNKATNYNDTIWYQVDPDIAKGKRVLFVLAEADEGSRRVIEASKTKEKFVKDFEVETQRITFFKNEKNFLDGIFAFQSDEQIGAIEMDESNMTVESIWVYDDAEATAQQIWAETGD